MENLATPATKQQEYIDLYKTLEMNLQFHGKISGILCQLAPD